MSLGRPWPETWHVVTSDSSSVYPFPSEEGAKAWARELGFVADWHKAGGPDCEMWGCFKEPSDRG